MVYLERSIKEPQPAGLPAYISGETKAYELDGSQPPAEIMLVQANPVLRRSRIHSRQRTLITRLQPVADYVDDIRREGSGQSFPNKDVRLALCKAIDKIGLVVESSTDWRILLMASCPTAPNFNPELQNMDVNVFDVEAAKTSWQMLDSRIEQDSPSWKCGSANPSVFVGAFAQAIQARWKENLGIDVDLKPAHLPDLTPASFGDKQPQSVMCRPRGQLRSTATFSQHLPPTSLGDNPNGRLSGQTPTIRQMEPWTWQSTSNYEAAQGQPGRQHSLLLPSRSSQHRITPATSSDQLLNLTRMVIVLQQ